MMDLTNCQKDASEATPINLSTAAAPAAATAPAEPAQPAANVTPAEEPMEAATDLSTPARPTADRAGIPAVVLEPISPAAPDPDAYIPPPIVLEAITPPEPEPIPARLEPMETPTSTTSTDAATPLSSASTTEKRRRRRREPAKVETPTSSSSSLKRQRIPTQRYQPPEEEPHTPTAKTPGADTPEKVMLYKKGTFLAVRNESEGFYLCRAQQNIFRPSKAFKIQWLNSEKNSNIFKMDYDDKCEPECVVSNVRLERIARETYQLSMLERTKVEAVLRKAINVEKGIAESPESSTSSEEDSEEEEDGLSTPSKPKLSKPDAPKSASAKNAKAKPSTSSVKSKASSTTATTTKITNDVKPKVKQDVLKRPPLTKEKEKSSEKKKGPDRHLKPNPRIRVLEKDPFYETNDIVPYISKQVQGRLAIRAVLTNDMLQLRTLLKDHDTIYKLDCMKCLANPQTALHYAIKKQNTEAIELLVNEFFGDNERIMKCKPQSLLIDKQDTGSYNFRSIGVQHIRGLSAGRGNREGNNAFTKDLSDMRQFRTIGFLRYLDEALKMGVDLQTLHTLVDANKYVKRDDQLSEVYCHIQLAVMQGHRKLAGHLVEEAEKYGGYGFNAFHKDVLLFDKEDLRPIHAASARKKPLENYGMTPLHCAATNPNVKYLTKLLSSEPDFNLMDKSQRRLIHYAAVCSGPAPLELLLLRGAFPHEIDTQGMTPLHYACQTGRVHNVELLLKKAKTSTIKPSDIFLSKYGQGGINRPNRASYCPVHLAAERGKTDVVRCLLKYKVDFNKILSANRDKLTPLMCAAANAHLDITRLLVEAGAPIEQTDKLKRSALTHAVMNGNTHVASYLLRMGADPNRTDSSGNSVVHYAAAYGWYFCLKLLVYEARADANKANDWKLTPVAVAFLKGHMGLVDYLLSQPGVDINFRDDKGQTLVSIAAASPLVGGLYEQMLYLVKDKGADCTKVDIDGCNALHLLAKNNVHSSSNRDGERSRELVMEYSVKIADLLLKHGCNPALKNADGQTPLMLAIAQVNVPLAKLLVQKGSTISSEQNKEGKTILHLMAEQCMETELAPLLRILADQQLELRVPKNKKLKPPKPESEVMETPPSLEPVNGEVKNNVGADKFQTDVEMKDMEKAGKETTDKQNVPNEVVTPLSNGVSEEKSEPTNKVEKMDVDKPELVNEAADDMDIEIQFGATVLKQMANTMNWDGFTPLLQACNEYYKFNKIVKPNVTHNMILKHWENGRGFIAMLIEVTGADINIPVQKKHNVDDVPVKDEDKYVPEAQWCALHFLANVEHELPVTVGGMKIGCPGLKLLLQYQPQLEQLNLKRVTPLMTALLSGREQSAELLLSVGADANILYHPENTPESHAVSPLLMAARRTTLGPGVIKAILANGGIVDVKDSISGYTAVHYVVESNESGSTKLKKLQVLAEGGANINAVDVNGRTPLHLAVNQNTGKSDVSLDIEEFLLLRGADVFAKDTHERLPLHYAFVKIGEPTDNSDLDPMELCGMLTASMAGHSVDERDYLSQTPLHRAAIRGATICCMHLVQRGAGINKKDKTGNSPLSLAVLNSHNDCAIMLIQEEADVRDNIVESPLPSSEDVVDGQEKAPITWRVLNKNKTEAKKVYSIFQGAISLELQGVAHLILHVPSASSKMTLTMAVQAAIGVSKFHLALRLLKRIADDHHLQTVDSDGRTLLHTLALKTDPEKEIDIQLKIAEILITRGLHSGIADNYGCTALIYAGLSHHYKLGHFILQNDQRVVATHADRFARDVMAATFWNVADLHGGHQGTRDWISALQKHGCSVDLLCDYPILDSLLFGYSSTENSVDSYFTSNGAITTSPLIVAIQNCEFDLVKFMLNHGASANVRDCLGVTPIMHAAKMNDVVMVKLLLDHSYNPDAIVTKAADKPQLARKMSRQLFMIKQAPAAAAEQEEGDKDKAKDESDKDTATLADSVEDQHAAGSDVGDTDEEMDDEDDERSGSDEDSDTFGDKEYRRKISLKVKRHKAPKKKKVPTATLR